MPPNNSSTRPNACNTSATPLTELCAPQRKTDGSGNRSPTNPSSGENAKGSPIANSAGRVKCISSGLRRPTTKPSPIPKKQQIRVRLLK
jgi:hypothetical protein